MLFQNWKLLVVILSVLGTVAVWLYISMFSCEMCHQLKAWWNTERITCPKCGRGVPICPSCRSGAFLPLYCRGWSFNHEPRRK